MDPTNKATKKDEKNTQGFQDIKNNQPNNPNDSIRMGEVLRPATESEKEKYGLGPFSAQK
ncbi:hypothetical protein FOCG_18079 [Fusarium oxysporum f. sp. radicis-lycopersici 26381]|nr:hypothetical protein FOWG_16947 [Fusarium oxysporum f. sp. lycopersici MN25]EXL39308.1 hypothetical protein FOCG_18079 [Fusarium oxysporum f. sp. radicis-lycopersici 26381]